MRNYNDPLYKTWRQKVRARDKHMCAWPNCKCRKKLQVHHIKRWATVPAMKYDVNNGITLCKEHHDLTKGREESFEPVFYRLICNANNKRHA